MNNTKLSNPVRLIAFFLTAFLLVCTFGFTADGWQSDDTAKNENSDGPLIVPPETTDREQNTNDDLSPNIPDVYAPQFVNRITGLEIDEKFATKAHLAFVLDSNAFYGISGADLVCQIPIENGEIRTVAFVLENDKLWKIGSVANTRGYIQNIAKYFGGVSVSNGYRDLQSYIQCDISGMQIDLSIDKDFAYTEFENNIYTNSDLLKAALEFREIDLYSILAPTLPYDFIDFGNAPVVAEDISANSVTITYSEKYTTRLVYNVESGKYSLGTTGTTITDGMNGKSLEFENCFVLFADSVTYDTPQGSQMIMDTIGKGKGYYITHGGTCEIEWSATQDGAMTFTDSDGNKLKINRGSIYLSFVKSSMTDKIIFQ